MLKACRTPDQTHSSLTSFINRVHDTSYPAHDEITFYRIQGKPLQCTCQQVFGKCGNWRGHRGQRSYDPSNTMWYFPAFLVLDSWPWAKNQQVNVTVLQKFLYPVENICQVCISQTFLHLVKNDAVHSKVSIKGKSTSNFGMHCILRPYSTSIDGQKLCLKGIYV